MNQQTHSDYCLFDGALISHMTSDLMRNYDASLEEVKNHINKLYQKIFNLNPIVFYLKADNVEERLIEARKSRGQTPPSKEQILFWKKRKDMDLKIIEGLEFKAYIMDISEKKWDDVQKKIYNNLMENRYVMGNKENYDWLMESKEQLETCRKIKV